MFSKSRFRKFFSVNLSKFLQMRLNNFLFRFLPFALSRYYLATLGELYYLLHWREKRLIRQAIGYTFKNRLEPGVLEEKMRDTFTGIFDHYHEKLFLAYSHFKRLLKFLKNKIRFFGEEKLQEALAAGKGVIMVTGHYGAVEFLPGALAAKGYPAAMICRFQTSRLRKSLTQRARVVDLDLIDADDGNIVLAAMKALKQGRILITECDEFDEWRPDPHRHSYFLNCQMPVDRSLDILRKRSGAPVLTALMERDGYQHYTMNLTPVANGDSPRSTSEECLRILEAAIEARPEQWYQWKKFGKIIKSRLEVEHDRKESGYLAPEVGISLADQA
jgi:KDO2-lipid IV(A) lauroyltransferase